MDRELFPVRLRALRESRGLTREELGNLVGVSYNQVVNWELGRRFAPLSRLKRIYEALGVTPEQFWNKCYMPRRLFKKNAPTSGVIGAGIPDIDENGRAITCPRCGNDSHSAIAMYCSECAFPLFNMCSGEERHKNVPSAKYCEMCGAQTYWSMSEDELQTHGIPPLG